MFGHHNPLKNDDDYLYFIRCIDRFKNLLKKKENKLFIITFQWLNEHNVNLYINKIIEFNEEFKKYTNNYILLVILHYYKLNELSHKFTFHDNIHFLHLCASETNGIEFKNDIENNYLDNIINKSYNFNILGLN
jgi:hypothetical protein